MLEVFNRIEMTLAIIFGFIFGLLLSLAQVNKNTVIAGMATQEDFRVAKTMAAGVGVGVILIALFVVLGWAEYHTKPLILGGIFWGGLLFGTGMAILGYCPGTLTISMGQGALDALIGALGGLLGGAVFTLAKPTIQPILDNDLGNQYLYRNLQEFPVAYLLISAVFGVGVLLIAYRVHQKDKNQSMMWLYTGSGLGVLNAIMILDATSGRPIGASTAFPYLADAVLGLKDNAYYQQIKGPGLWETYFLIGAFFAGLAYALVRKEFRLQLIFEHWERYKGKNKGNRIFWSFFGGFMLLFGARMAGGCTSGHILSGSMQFAKSSLIFAAFVFIGFLLTGKLFYHQRKQKPFTGQSAMKDKKSPILQN